MSLLEDDGVQPAARRLGSCREPGRSASDDDDVDIGRGEAAHPSHDVTP
jgi:hypothetical protein